MLHAALDVTGAFFTGGTVPPVAAGTAPGPVSTS